MLAAARRRHEQVAQRRKQHLGRPDQQGRDVVGLDPEPVTPGIERAECAKDDTDEIVGHGI